MTQSRPISTVVASITSTTQTSITVGWTPLTLSSDLGYAPLIRYQIYWNQGPDPVDPWVYKQQALTNTSTIGGLTPGNSYSFRVYSENMHGISDSSNIVTSKAASVPAKITILSTTQVGSEVKLEWSAPNDMGGTII